MSAFNVVLVRPMIAEEANPPKPLEVRLPILVVDNAFRSALVKTETWVLVSACNLDELNPAIAVAFRPAMPSVASDARASFVNAFNLLLLRPDIAELLIACAVVELIDAIAVVLTALSKFDVNSLAAVCSNKFNLLLVKVFTTALGKFPRGRMSRFINAESLNAFNILLFNPMIVFGSIVLAMLEFKLDIVVVERAFMKFELNALALF